jgi:TetR/AcrR family fatty acid metabolism transcriptional regulator
MEKAKRKEREFNLRRAEILEAAVEIFAAKGFYNATVAEIAAASGFAIGTLYQFFESKEQLYTAMLTEKLEVMYAGLQKAVGDEADSVKKIELLVASQFQFVEDNAEFCSIFVGGDYLSLAEGSTELRKRMRSDYARYVSFIEGVMREGIRTGVLKEMDLQMITAALMGIINSCISRWLTMAEKAPLKGKIPFVLDIFLEGVRKDAH